jgi:hypothetical protein
MTRRFSAGEKQQQKQKTKTKAKAKAKAKAKTNGRRPSGGRDAARTADLEIGATIFGDL